MQGKKLLHSIRLTNLLSYGSEGVSLDLEPLNVLIGPAPAPTTAIYCSPSSKHTSRGDTPSSLHTSRPGLGQTDSQAAASP